LTLTAPKLVTGKGKFGKFVEKSFRKEKINKNKNLNIIIKFGVGIDKQAYMPIDTETQYQKWYNGKKLIIYSKDKNDNAELYPDFPLGWTCFRVKESDIEIALNSGKVKCTVDICDLTKATIGCIGCICKIEKSLNKSPQECVNRNF
jgi:hypothetical protein